ncbi:ClpP/crotonase [Atractiella rhizophila]|nr:ClpP/crotonase [Atractiella rhizophila]
MSRAIRSTRPLVLSLRTQPLLRSTPALRVRSFHHSPARLSVPPAPSTVPGIREYANILFSTVGNGNNVALITLNRPKAYNALSAGLFVDLNHALDACASPESGIRAVVITGGHPKAFAAGADIKEMASKSFADVYTREFLGSWQRISSIDIPIVGAINGLALGGGCELAMMCDILLASPNASFGQPEINLGVIPGSGGTQRLTAAIGKSRAMELILTGKSITATEAASYGLVSRVSEDVVTDAVAVAEEIASKSKLAIKAAKEAVNAAAEVPLEAGVKLERRLFHSLFATEDQKEGMQAFVQRGRQNGGIAENGTSVNVRVNPD